MTNSNYHNLKERQVRSITSTKPWKSSRYRRISFTTLCRNTMFEFIWGLRKSRHRYLTIFIDNFSPSSQRSDQQAWIFYIFIIGNLIFLPTLPIFIYRRAWIMNIISLSDNDRDSITLLFTSRSKKGMLGAWRNSDLYLKIFVIHSHKRFLINSKAQISRHTYPIKLKDVIEKRRRQKVAREDNKDWIFHDFEQHLHNLRLSKDD